MRLQLRDLWTWQGRIGRTEYAFWGVLLFCLKYAIDRTVAEVLFQHSWDLWRYFVPIHSKNIFKIPESESLFYITLIALALPFIAVGTALTVRRLRDVRAPEWLVIVFFIPIFNLILFLILSLLPPKPPPLTQLADPRQTGRWIPQSKTGSALLAILLNVATGLVFTSLSVQTLSQYGWGLFVGLPFSIGLTSAMIYSFHQRRTVGECLSVAFASIGALFLMLLVFAYEGFICLVMAAPITVALALLGGWLGYKIQFGGQGSATKFCALAMMIVPLGMSGEKYLLREAEVFSVTTAIEIKAPASEVWKNVVAFAEIPEPSEWYFRAGLAYPVRAHIDGSGAGAIRHCVFSTGEFTEPIQIWNEPHLLRFRVTANPPPMDEMTFYAKIHPAHLSNFFVSHQGEFLLIQLDQNRTLVKGTTWYQHHMRPEKYWRLWSDWIIHRIHTRVLRHIQKQTE
jgi:uncharacterized membrane protein YhaH (DUF805 family)